MKTPEEILEILMRHFGDDTVALVDETTDMVLEVNPASVKKVCLYLNEDKELSFDNLMCLSGVDNADGKIVEDEQGDKVYEGGTLSVYYHLFSFGHKHKVTLKTTVERSSPEVESVATVWGTADWHEREAYDMFGIVFKNHHNLKRILMPYDWEAGYPLRKDYKDPEFYKGMKVPY